MPVTRRGDFTGSRSCLCAFIADRVLAFFSASTPRWGTVNAEIKVPLSAPSRGL